MTLNIEELFYDCLAFIQIASVALFTIVKNLFENIIEKIKNIDVKPLLLNAVLLYSNISVTLTTEYKKLCEKYIVLNDINEHVCYLNKIVLSFVNGNRIEPMYTNWVSISSIYTCESEPHPTYIYSEAYNDLNGIDEDIDAETDNLNYKQSLLHWYNLSKVVVINQEKMDDCLITMKYGDKYAYKVCNKKSTKPTDTPCELSSVKFINIEYCHPELKNPINIDIDKMGYLIGNEILSSTFVKRALDYGVNILDFDTKYVLKIMDNNINTFELKSNQYILLEKDGYKVMTNE
jgi:hypothetical protein